MIPAWLPGYRESAITALTNLAVQIHGNLLPVEQYASDGDGVYFKAKMPGGGTIEVHLLREDYFSEP